MQRPRGLRAIAAIARLQRRTGALGCVRTPTVHRQPLRQREWAQATFRTDWDQARSTLATADPRGGRAVSRALPWPRSTIDRSMISGGWALTRLGRSRHTNVELR